MNRLCIMIAVLFMGAFPMTAFSGAGGGTEKDPYIITTADELFEVRNDLGAYYKLGNDIDLTDFIREDSPKYGWVPIGNLNSPFTGSFDGNNHSIRGLYISRENEDYIGLFGYVRSGFVKNLGIINPHIHGRDCVGAVAGELDDSSNSISSVIVGGSIIGGYYVGGVCGIMSKGHLNSCMVDSHVDGRKYIGGIIGYETSGCDISDNMFSGYVKGEDWVGGIVGEGRTSMTVSHNIVKGSVYSMSKVSGIYLVSNVRANANKGNVCAADTISGNEFYRVSNSESGLTNYACNSTVVISNGKEQTVLEDTPQNGIALSLRMLKKQSTYEGIGFDFANTWKIEEGVGLPYLKVQSDPIKVTSFVGGSKSIISGTGVGSGMVGVLIGDNLYESYMVDGSWSVSLGNVRPGTVVRVFAVEAGKLPSITVVATAEQDSSTPDYKKGDANGDGVVDAADVVGIINHIIGKTSATFNSLNADINGDGQVLVDDAVGAVELIMKEQ